MVIVVFWDGLRPDFVTPDLTPNLCRLIQQGVNFTNHHAVFPSETRVNASSVATGCYPGTHGVVGNRIYVPAVNEGRALNTGDHEDLIQLSQHEALLSVPTLAKTLVSFGKTYVIFSSGSPGSSWVQCAPNTGHMVNVRGVVHPEYLLSEIENRYGTLPPESVPASARNDLTVQLMIDAIGAKSYDVIFGWLCDPDLTQHKVGLGADLARQAIRENDKRLAGLMDVAEDVDLMVCSDHGFSTLAKPFDQNAALQAAGFELDRMVWTGNGVTLKAGYKDKLPDLVEFFAQQDCIGPIFTRGNAGDSQGQVPGTFSLDVSKLDHWRTPDVMFSKRWSDLANAYGVKGHVFGSGGVASHGSCSPYDLHNVLVASGPTFKQGAESGIASGVIDIAPTVQKIILGKVYSKSDGRVLKEGMVGEETPTKMDTSVIEAKMGNRCQYMQISRVEDAQYIDKGWV